MKLIIIILTALLSSSLPMVAKGMMGKLLADLDRAIDSIPYYEQKKQEHIRFLKESLRGTERPSLLEEYRINMKLYEAYEAYICDSAMCYANRNMEIARRLDDMKLLDVMKMKKANILGKTGLYEEGARLLRSVGRFALTPEELAEYYITLADISLFRAEYAVGTEYNHEYLKQLYAYRDSVLSVAVPGTYHYVITCAMQMFERGKGKEAARLLEDYLPKLSPSTRQYAIASSILAFICQNIGDKNKFGIYLVKSAIADIKGVVKENNSMRVLAELLYSDNQLKRADRYMKHSMEDANFYNARLRNVQAAKMLPIIDHAYQLERERNLVVLKILLLAITLLALSLVAAMCVMVRQRRKLLLANGELNTLNGKLVDVNMRQNETNRLLQEANLIKERYVGHFMGLCSVYIGKLDAYRRALNKLAAGNRREELVRILKSSDYVNKELKDFYHNFDKSFLDIFPDFVERFNALLPMEERIHPKKNELLTTMLRVFALIRLGVTDSALIADFLHCSITTIYTYRSKMKNYSLCKDVFEDEIMKIGCFCK